MSYFFVEVSLFLRCWLEMKCSKVSTITCDNPCNKYECTLNTIVFFMQDDKLEDFTIEFQSYFPQHVVIW